MAFQKPASSSIFNRFVGFSVIGLINTAIHFALVIVLVEGWGENPVLANSIGFVAANMFSFLANSRWNYRVAISPGRYGRFLIVSLLGLVTTALMSGLAEYCGWHYLVGVGLVFISLPVLTFFAHDRWTWPGHVRGSSVVSGK